LHKELRINIQPPKIKYVIFSNIPKNRETGSNMIVYHFQLEMKDYGSTSDPLAWVERFYDLTWNQSLASCIGMSHCRNARGMI
jgi:hypothetical protein